MRIGVLGPLEVQDSSGERLELRGGRLCALLIRLALEPGQVVTRAQLVDSVWEEGPPARAANALQALVSRLRRTLPAGTVQSHPAGYRLALSPDAIDLHQFERLLVAARAALPSEPAAAVGALTDALRLWRGPALADVPDAEFARATATRLAEQRLRAVEDLVEVELRLGRGRPDITTLESVVAEHPTRERAVALLMRALAAGGRPAEALTAYERLRTALAEELGTDPGPDVAAVHLQILRGQITPVQDADQTPPAAGESLRSNLRADVTSFIGRDEDLTRVRKLVAESRLVTLTGPGGAGKTRLALESARTLLDQTPDGAWLAQLAPVANPSEVPHAILAALGLRDSTAVPLTPRPARGEPAWSDLLDDLAEHLDTQAEAIDRLVGALADKNLLLVLDNCEHLVDAVATLVDHLLGSCPSLRILTTSREPLDITGESLWPVAPLELPPSDADANQAVGYPAVQLFLDRASAAYPDFQLDDHTAADIVRICRALDGMPLAIELAAARLRSIDLGQVAQRIDDRFGLLATGSRTARPGHQTLRAVVDWSWELLDDDERTLLRRLAYFTGGATTDAAEQIMAVDIASAADTLHLLSSLTDKSLLVLDRNGQARYRMLETIKAYGLERLAEADETEQVRQAHAAYFLELAETAEPFLRTGAQLEWLRRLDSEHANLHAALRAAIAAGDAVTAIRFVAALGWYWNLRAQRIEGLQLSSEALNLPGDVPDEVRALAYVNGGMCGAYWPLDESHAEQWFRTALEIVDRVDGQRHPMLRLARPMYGMFQGLATHEMRWTVPDELIADHDPWVRGAALIMRAYSTFATGTDHERGEHDLHLALSAFRFTGDRSAIGMALGAVAEAASWRGEFGVAVDHTEQALALVTELGSLEDVVQLRIFLARQLWLLGDGDTARRQLTEAIRDADRIGVRELQVSGTLTTADFDRFAGAFGPAREHLERAEQFAAFLRSDSELHCLLATALGCLATATGDVETADRHHRRAVELASSSGDAMMIARALVGLADLAMARGQAELAGELLGASEAARGRPDRSLIDADRVAAAARATLGDAEFDEAHARGRHRAPDARQLATVTFGA
jgi:predicted ATPase/DNA-binding SARP family transcriptional activator